MNAKGMRIFYVPLLIGICNAELKLLQVTFRHGDRTPISDDTGFYPNDPYGNLTYFPEGYGGLTNGGKARAYKLGVFLREMYDEFLGDVYADSLFYFRSSDISRTKMSSELVAAGIFPPVQLQRWNQTLDWQPIPIWNTDLYEDILFFGPVLCTRVTTLRTELEASDPDLLKREEDLADFFEYLSEHVGSNVTQQIAYVLYTQLYAQYKLGLEIPEWAEDIFPYGKLYEVGGYDYVIQSYTQEMQSYNGGLWLKEWLTNVDNYINGSATYRGLFYGGHEINVAGILVSLGVFTPHMPEYSSSVIFELHEYNGEYFVRALHKDIDVAVELEISGCGGIYCHLDTFRDLFADIILDDPLETCEIREF